MQGSLPSSSIKSIWDLWRRSLLCLHPSRVCRHRAYCKWRATSRLRNPTSTSLTNTSIGLRIGRLWVSTSTSNLLTTKQYSSFCFWLSAWFRPSHGQPGSNPQVLVNALIGEIRTSSLLLGECLKVSSDWVPTVSLNFCSVCELT